MLDESAIEVRRLEDGLRALMCHTHDVCWQSSDKEHTCAGVWITVWCCGFFRRVDPRETILMVGLSAARGSDDGGSF